MNAPGLTKWLEEYLVAIDRYARGHDKSRTARQAREMAQELRAAVLAMERLMNGGDLGARALAVVAFRAGELVARLPRALRPRRRVGNATSTELRVLRVYSELLAAGDSPTTRDVAKAARCSASTAARYLKKFGWCDLPPSRGAQDRRTRHCEPIVSRHVVAEFGGR